MFYFGDKEDVAYYMRRLYEKGLTTTLGGNMSKRVHKNTIFMSPSGTDKSRLHAWQIAMVTLDGENHTPELKPSIELQMHIAIYKARPDISCIIHAHPPYASIYSFTKQKMNTRLISESRLVLGELGYAEYAMFGSQELADNVSKASKDANVVIMKNHGVIALANNLALAFERIEALENLAKMNLMKNFAGEAHELSDEQVAALDAFMLESRIK